MKNSVELKLTKAQASLLFEVLSEAKNDSGPTGLLLRLHDETGRLTLDIAEEIGEIQQELIRASMDEDVVNAAEAYRPEFEER